MKQVLYIIFATGFTYLTSLAAGMTLLRLLRLRFDRSEERFLGFLLGSACLSAVVFALSAAGLVYRGVFLVVGLFVIGMAVWRSALRFSAATLKPCPVAWNIGFLAIYAVFTWLYLSNALAPEVSPDGAGYHVALVARYYREHHFPHITS